jgi:LPS-assembly protein
MPVGGTTGVLKTLAAALLLAALLARPAAAQQSPFTEAPALIAADQITYDENLSIVTASGNVEMAQNDRVLLADTVSYNLKTNVVTASGNISLLEPGGNVVFADFVELTDNMAEGFIRNIRVLLADHSRLAAASGLRTGGNTTVFKKGVFSPCELCRDDPTRAPLWQLKALEIEHDQDDRVIRYRDAWMEIFGIPIFYTPYFEHPDPTVERQSGLLAPTFGNSDVLGTTYQQPYFWAIGPDKDATFAPILTTNQGVTAAGEYRQIFRDGRVDLRGSLGVSDRTESDGTIDEDALRGHIDGTARFDINKAWRWGVDAQRATDDTYLRIYNFSSERTLTSRAFAEGFNGRNYLALNSFLYQGLRSTDINDELPIILPLAEYNYMSDPGVAGGKYTMDASLLGLTRVEGRDSRRVSVALGWELPYTGPAGDVYNLVARVQGDGYWVNGVEVGSDDVNPTGVTESTLTGRVFPQLALQWRYPWVRNSGTTHQVIEPIAQVVVAPTGFNPGEIPNEDSLDFEFDDTNLFSLNRFTGVDRVDPGTRVDYGLKWTVTGDEGGWASAFVGQSYRLESDSVFEVGSGVEDNLSDIVGRVEIKPTYKLGLRYRFRFDKNDFSTRRNELDLQIGPPAIHLNLGYTLIDTGAQTDEFGEREELNWTLNSRLSRYWSAFGGQRIDLVQNLTLQSRIGLVYADECCYIQAVFERSEFSDREIEPEDSFFVNVVFKYLGGVSSSGGNAFGG